MISRRGVLTGSLFLVAASPNRAMASPFKPVISFEVSRNGDRIGQHTIRFRQDGALLEAEINVDLALRLGPIVLYRYTHKCREIWRDGAFASLESETDDDGTRFRVKAARTPESIVVEVSDASRAIFPPDAIPLTHWNNLCMQRPLFSPQDGTPIASSVVPRGEDMVPLADGRLVRATRYSLIGKVALDDWYDTARQWTALRAPGRDGSMIEYRRAA